MKNTKEEAIVIAKYQSYMAKTVYNAEIRREDSLIHQAGNMQAAFSFTTAALFMATPVMLEYRGILPFELIYVAVSSVAVVLLFSLFFFFLAQNRRMRDSFISGKDFINYIEAEEALFSQEQVRYRYLAKQYAEIEEAIKKINEKRVFWIRLSMWSFYLALCLCVLWFLLALVIMALRI